jgi:hypothetical protein
MTYHQCIYLILLSPEGEAKVVASSMVVIRVRKFQELLVSRIVPVHASLGVSSLLRRESVLRGNSTFLYHQVLEGLCSS